MHHGTRRRRALGRRVLFGGAELLVTTGVLLLLLVAHQMWWTNWEAREGAARKVEALERAWEREGEPGDGAQDVDADTNAGADAAAGTSGSAAPTSQASGSGSGSGRGFGSGGGPSPAPATARRPLPSQAYAVLTVPRLRLRVPVAEGTGRRNVLDKGYVGHYPGTQQPGRPGNFALAGHRNTHGEPFRHLDRLRPRDTVRVETATAVFTYVVDRVLPRTSPGDSGVLRPVPRSLTKPAYGYSAPGHYLTLTTCTPAYTSTYRLVVWGKLTSMRPRSQ